MIKSFESKEKESTRELITSKIWYSFDKNGIFSWKKSLENLGERLRVDPRQLGEIFASSFSFDALTKVKRSKKDPQEQEKVPLLKALKDDDFSYYLWSVGDENWQKEKIRRTGADQWLSEDDCFFFPKRKEQGLSKIINRIFSRSEGLSPEDILLIIVDDKNENLKKAEKYLKNNQFSAQWLTYHFKINDQQADANAFYLWLHQLRNKFPDRRIELILDFDGVVVDTSRVLANQVVEGIFNLIISKG